MQPSTYLLSIAGCFFIGFAAATSVANIGLALIGIVLFHSAIFVQELYHLEEKRRLLERMLRG